MARSAKFVVYENKGWRWKLVSRGNVVAKSPKAWPGKHHAVNAARAVARNAGGASVEVDE